MFRPSILLQGGIWIHPLNFITSSPQCPLTSRSHLQVPKIEDSSPIYVSSILMNSNHLHLNPGPTRPTSAPSDFFRFHPGKLTWNTIMEVWFRWFSFSIGWFLGSMLIFQGCCHETFACPKRFLSLHVKNVHCLQTSLYVDESSNLYETNSLFKKLCHQFCIQTFFRISIVITFIIWMTEKLLKWQSPAIFFRKQHKTATSHPNCKKKVGENGTFISKDPQPFLFLWFVVVMFGSSFKKYSYHVKIETWCENTTSWWEVTKITLNNKSKFLSG